MVIQGRSITADEIGLIRGLMVEYPDWCRTRLSEELCRCWNWRNGQGRIEDMAARALQGLTNNTRFLVLPWVEVPHLASHVLALIARRIRGDWQAKYGHPVHALETFVDRSRFRGTCYRAANWLRLGATRGRNCNDRHSRIQVSVKDVYLYPLRPDFRRPLCAPVWSPTEGRVSR